MDPTPESSHPFPKPPPYHKHLLLTSSIPSSTLFSNPDPCGYNTTFPKPSLPYRKRSLVVTLFVLCCRAARPVTLQWSVYSYEALAAMHDKSREDRKNDEAAGIIIPMGASIAAGVGGGMDAAAEKAARAERARAARARRLRAKNEPCLLPDRLLHRVRGNRKYCLHRATSCVKAIAPKKYPL